MLLIIGCMNRNSLIGSLVFLLSVSPSLLRAQSFPPVWNNTSSYVAGDMVTDYGNVYRCIRPVTTPYMDPSKDYTNWELNFARSNTTLLIGSGETFPTLATAWTYCENSRVAQGAYLHLNIVTTNGNFNETFASAFSLDHQSGSQVSIIGDNESNIDLSFPNSNGFTIDAGHGFQVISNLTISGGGPTGISATQGGAIADLADVNVAGFGIAYSATDNASLTVASSCSGTPTGTVFYATQSGSITIGAGIILLGMGPGSNETAFWANLNGTISAYQAEVVGFGIGVLAQGGGTIYIDTGEVSDCATGVLSQDGGRVFAIYTRFGAVAPFGIANFNDLQASRSGTIFASPGDYSTKQVGGTDGSFIYSTG